MCFIHQIFFEIFGPQVLDGPIGHGTGTEREKIFLPLLFSDGKTEDDGFRPG
jgi:hypothetical protein